MSLYEVKYQIPYNNLEWRVQSFQSKDEAERMIIFYQSCGTKAHLIQRSYVYSK